MTGANGESSGTFKRFIAERLAPVVSFVGALAYVLAFFGQLQDQATKLGFRVFAVGVLLTFGLLVWHVYRAQDRSVVLPDAYVPRFSHTKRCFAVAAFLLSFVPLAFSMRPAPELRILHVSPVLVGGRLALDIVVQNVSSRRQPITRIEVGLSQDNLINMIGSTIYHIANATVDVSSNSVTGQTTMTTPTMSAQQVTLPLTGQWTLHDRGAWSLDLGMPIREDVEAGGSHRIVIILPTSIRLAGMKRSFFLLRLASVDHSPKELPISKFLGRTGRMLLRLKVIHGLDSALSYRGSVSFEPLSGSKLRDHSRQM